MAGLLELNSGTLERAALAYATLGWPVLPLAPKQKVPLTKNGLLDASTDLEQIRQWWGRSPGANIGLRTGIAFDAVDLDGQEALESLKRIAPGFKHQGPTSSTGKGYHLLFLPTGARNAARKAPGIDFRGQNGYIVASPSVHPNGHKYMWMNDTTELPPPAPWVDLIVTPQRTEPPKPRPAGFFVEPILKVWSGTFGAIPKYTLEPMGERWRSRCPWHDDLNPSLVLYPENDSMFCFACHEWGDSLDIATSFANEGKSPSDLRKERDRDR